MKSRHKITVDIDLLSTVIPEAKSLENLPRKKKKRLKKKIVSRLLQMANDYAEGLLEL
jgi:hypothetical protein